MQMSGEQFFLIAFWVLVGLMVVMRSWYAWRAHQAGERLLPDRASIRREGWGLFLFRVLGFLLLVALLVVPFVGSINLRMPLPLWLRWAGLALGLASLGLWSWTHAELGRLWSVKLRLREDHRLISSGPYVRVRHPMYSAILGWAVGLGLVVASWLPLAFAAVGAVVFFARSQREEKMMLERFGDEYRAYMKATGRFLPRW